MKTILGRRAFTAGMAAAVPAVALPAAAQAYPSQLVKLVVPFPLYRNCHETKSPTG